MSKIRKRKRKKKIQRIRRRIVIVTAFVCVTTFGFWAASMATGEIAEPIPVVHMEKIDTEQYIQTEPTAKEAETPRTYQDVEFVPLPVLMTEQDQAVVFRICQEYEVAFPLVMAIIEHESHFDRTARSQTGDSGYMQINDCNADDLAKLGFSDLYDLEQNVGAGVHILQGLFSEYGGDTTFVLMAYNAGKKGAQRMRESGIYETEYTVEILERAEAFSSYIDNVTTDRTDVR